MTALRWILAAALAGACSKPALTATPRAPRRFVAAGEVEVWVTTGDRSTLLQKEPNLASAAAAT